MTKKTLNKKDYKYWTKFRSSSKNSITGSELKRISTIHSEVFEHKYKLPCTCNPKGIQRFINDINNIYNSME